jgi:DNA polymerase III alpha subunit
MTMFIDEHRDDYGVEVRPVSVNHSQWDRTLEPRADGSLTLRFGFCQIKGMRAEDADWIVAARGNGYPDIESLWRRAGVGADTLERLAEADAFTALALTRRDALWEARALRGPGPLPLFGADGERGVEQAVALAPMTLGEEMIEDYLALHLSLRAQPMDQVRFEPSVSDCTSLICRLFGITTAAPPRSPGTSCGLQPPSIAAIFHRRATGACARHGFQGL